jgi:LmbE family N-acetylglucosaminyl deacetylase
MNSPIEEFYRADAASTAVVLSPHSDDAAFSLAGTLHLIAESGGTITIVNYFSMSAFTPFAPHLDSTESTDLRKREDRQFAKLLGARCSMIWLDVADAPLRGYNPRMVCRTGELSVSDGKLVTDMYQMTVPVLNPGCAVFAPLGIGGHIDHRIVVEVAKQVAMRGTESLYFYEEIPYAALRSDEENAGTALRVASELHQIADPFVISFPGLLDLKLNSVFCYPSQVGSSYTAGMRTLKDRLARERVWRFRRHAR